MWMKFLGSVLVVSATTSVGFSFASRYSNRPRQISQVISCLTALKAYINYVSMPLPEALAHAGDSVDGAVKELFQRTSDVLAADGWISPRQAIEIVLREMVFKLALNKPEKDIMLQLGANLGVTNREEQEKYLIMVIEELGRIEEDSRRARDQNVKMLRYLGVCGGLTVVILLV